MKRIGNLWGSLVDPDNLEKAARKACASRKDRAEVSQFDEDRGMNLLGLRQSLEEGSYRSSRYRLFPVDEHGKRREVADLPLYPDRILHWAICLVAEDPINKKLIDQTYGSRPGTGYHDAVRKVYGYIQGDSRIRYALVTDVRHFFASIDKDILKSKLARVLKDYRLLDLMFGIIDDYPNPGIPIGNRTSPMLANLYLSEMDHRMKEVHRCHYYVRYMDDIVIPGYSKPWLHRMKGVLEGYLGELGLELKGNWQVFPIDSRGIPYLGYRIFSDHILLKKPTKLRMQSSARRIEEKLRETDYVLDRHDLGVVHSYEGVLKWCNGKNLRRRTFNSIYELNERNLALREMRI